MTSIRSNSKKKDKVRELTAEEKEYAAIYLNETDDNRDNAISEIKRWMLKEKLNSPSDDFFILRFLRPCKFDVEKTKVKMRKYLQHRKDLPEWYKNRDPFKPKIRAFLDLGTFLSLRKLNDDGDPVFIANYSYDPRKQELDDFCKVATMIFDIIAKDHVPLSLRGIHVFLDVGNINFGHVRQMGFSVIRHMVNGMQCYPIRIQSINFINVPIYFNGVLAIFRALMTAKLKERFHSYPSGAENMFEQIPTDILPVEYGGTNQTIKELKEYWTNVAEDNRDWLVDNEKY